MPNLWTPIGSKGKTIGALVTGFILFSSHMAFCNDGNGLWKVSSHSPSLNILVTSAAAFSRSICSVSGAGSGTSQVTTTLQPHWA